ncbi:MAG: SpoIIIAH-like family protein [Clostridia bacterium]|nr:SpoIIIAH-like family protein [Clostridia bacterium]
MKKGKVLGKQSIVMFLMVIALCAAVWLNMKYSSVNTLVDNTASGYLGEALFVDSQNSDNAVQTAGKVSSDYLQSAKDERQNNRKEQIELLEDTIADAKISDDVKKSAVERMAQITKKSEQENAIETVLKAKGFEGAVAVISDENISIIVRSDGLLSSQTMQIQDAVTANCNVPLSNIKIITVK